MALERNPGIDTPAALDFMGEILSRMDRADLAQMTGRLEAKSRWVHDLLEPDRLAGLGQEHLYSLLRSFFPSRRRARAIVEVVGVEELKGALGHLVEGPGTLGERVEAFDRVLFDFEEVTVDLAWEVLHLYQPERWWLWTRWMWNTRTETGALRLVTADDVDLYGSDAPATYAKVGAALAVVHDTVRALGLVDDSPFAVDVFLAGVYGVYMYTVLRMRMSQEFNRIVPELPSLTRRLLGINEVIWEVEPCQ